MECGSHRLLIRVLADVIIQNAECGGIKNGKDPVGSLGLRYMRLLPPKLPLVALWSEFPEPFTRISSSVTS